MSIGFASSFLVHSVAATNIAAGPPHNLPCQMPTVCRPSLVLHRILWWLPSWRRLTCASSKSMRVRTSPSHIKLPALYQYPSRCSCFAKNSVHLLDNMGTRWRIQSCPQYGLAILLTFHSDSPSNFFIITAALPSDWFLMKLMARCQFSKASPELIIFTYSGGVFEDTSNSILTFLLLNTDKLSKS